MHVYYPGCSIICAFFRKNRLKLKKLSEEGHQGGDVARLWQSGLAVDQTHTVARYDLAANPDRSVGLYGQPQQGETNNYFHVPPQTWMRNVAKSLFSPGLGGGGTLRIDDPRAMWPSANRVMVGSSVINPFQLMSHLIQIWQTMANLQTIQWFKTAARLK